MRQIAPMLGINRYGRTANLVITSTNESAPTEMAFFTNTDNVPRSFLIVFYIETWQQNTNINVKLQSSDDGGITWEDIPKSSFVIDAAGVNPTRYLIEIIRARHTRYRLAGWAGAFTSLTFVAVVLNIDFAGVFTPDGITGIFTIQDQP